MRTNRRPGLILLFSLLLLASSTPLCHAQEPEAEERKTLSFGIRAGLWAAQLDASVKVSENVLTGSEVDLEGDLSFDDVFAFPAGEIFFTSRFVSISLDGFSLRSDSSATLNGRLDFAGQTFLAGQRVDAELELDSLALRLSITPLSLELVELGLVASLRYIRAAGEISGEFPNPLPIGGTISRSARDEVEAPLPMLGLCARVFLGFIEIGLVAQGLGLSVEYDGDEYKVFCFEAELNIALNIGDHFALLLAYRVLSADLERRQDRNNAGAPDDRYDLTLMGPSLSLRLRF
jgi:hypothetical protein